MHTKCKIMRRGDVRANKLGCLDDTPGGCEDLAHAASRADFLALKHRCINIPSLNERAILSLALTACPDQH